MNILNFQSLRQTAFTFQSARNLLSVDQYSGHPTTATITTGTSSVTC